VHAAKAGARPVVNAATGGLGTPIISLAEDILAVVASLVAILQPMLLLGLLVALAAFVAWGLSRWRSSRSPGRGSAAKADTA
jgi:hypothetical protein